MSDTKTATANFIMPVGAVSYPQIFEAKMPPNPKPGDKARFSLLVLFGPEAAMSESDQALMKALKAAAMKCAVDKFGQEKVVALHKDGKLGWPFRKDIASKGYPAEFESYISPWSHQAPGVVDRYAGPDGKAMPLADRSRIYPGSLVKVSVRPFAYDSNGNKGVSLGLQNIQAWDWKTPRIDGRTAAADEFSVEAAPEADLSALPVTGNAAPAASMGADLANLLG